jgi:hypothetical protein
MSKNEHHVVPNTSRGGWDVKRNGAQKASIHTETKVEAVKIGRVMSQRAGSGRVIHGKDGRIQQKDSHGNDPCPPRDKN